MDRKPEGQGPPIEVRKYKRENDSYRWSGTGVKEYRKTGDFFRDINKQVFFDRNNGFTCELRYFEVKPGGYSSCELHEHVHGVLILRGTGRVVGYSSEKGAYTERIGEHDVVYVPPLTWHQFQADENAYLGFLCLVENERDRPRRPTEEEAKEMKADPTIGDLVRL